jgi:CopG family nickel-responsive transcriptional regulator
VERITMSIDESLAKAFDQLIKDRGYASRSEAMRDLLRRDVEAYRHETDDAAYCVASLSYVYNHHERKLAERLAEAQHRHHNLVVSTMHVHLDHENCLEAVVLKGPAKEVRALADRTRSERGVRHAHLNVISVSVTDSHFRIGSHRHHGHMHFIPKS